MQSSDLRIRRWVATLMVLAAIAGGAITTGLQKWSSGSVYGAPSLPVTVAHDSAPIPLGSFANGFASVLKPALPAVVNIHTSKIVKPKGNQMMPFFNDPFFRQFFGNGQNMQPQPEREQSLGSGVIITSDGTILTNNHVIDGATDIKVDLADKRDFTAKLVGTDPLSDIAVLKINATGLPTLPIGDSSKLQVGDVVFAIGDPFGIGETATMGIVSAIGRTGLGIERYENFIQTDASINPGNSGGAMINLHGDLVGINTAILSEGSGGNEGIGFAIPIDMARNVMTQIVEHGKVTRGYLGLLPQPVTPEIAKEFGLSEPAGALVGSVEPGPAAKAGIKRGDIILKVNGESVTSDNDLRLKISQTAPGTTVRLTIWRDSRTQDVSVTLGQLPTQEAENNSEGENSGSGAMQGVQVQNLSQDMAQQLGVPEGTHGVVVTAVDQASPAAAAGVQRGLVIQEVNHKAVNNVQEYKQALQSAGDRAVLLLVMIPSSVSQSANGVTQYIVVEPH